jgi:hypothetical protein
MAVADRPGEPHLCDSTGRGRVGRPSSPRVTHGAVRASTSGSGIDLDSLVTTKAVAKRRRALNEAAHKLGYFKPPSSAAEERQAAVRRRFDALADSQRDVVADASKAVLALGALGVVYGDIGTSPLYTEQVIFTSHCAAA